MNQRSRNKISLVIIAILLVTNVVMLVMYFRMCKTQEEPKRVGFTEKLKMQVGFTPEQMSVYDVKKEAFINGIRQRFDQIKKTKEDFYIQMYDSTVSDSTLESKAAVIGDQQKDLDLHVIRHFKDVRKMCTHSQLPKYDSLLPSIIERMTTRPGKR
jgi:hypothetical protein